MPKIRKVIDDSDNNVIDMGILPNVRFFGLLVGKTGCGKTNLLINLLLNPEFGYDKIFKGENMYIFSGSLNSDEKIKKLIEVKEIPDENLYDAVDDDELNRLYNKLEEQYMERKEDDLPVEYPLILLDDLSFTGGFPGKRFNALVRFAQNSRKLGISVLVTTQYYSQILPSIRANISFAILYQCSQKNLEQIVDEHNFYKKRNMFIDMFRTNVKDKRDFIVVNYDNKIENLYLDKDFNSIHHDC